jgi:hypothetical protein
MLAKFKWPIHRSSTPSAASARFSESCLGAVLGGEVLLGTFAYNYRLKCHNGGKIKCGLTQT